MRATVLRCLLLVVLVVSVAVRFETNRSRASTANDFDAGSAVEAVIRAHGYALLENPVKPPKLLSAVVYFQRPECARASLVLPYYINAEVVELLARVTEPDFESRFFYIDRDWREQARVEMTLQWIKHLVLNAVGASRYVPVKKAIVLADPPGCHPKQTIDWRPIWERDRQTHAATEPATGANAGG